MRTSKNHLFLIFIIGFVICFFPLVLHSQQGGVSLDNIKNLKVDELTDTQVLEFIQKVEESGYTEDQLMVLARARGMSPSQISKLKERIAKVKAKDQTSTQRGQKNRLRESPFADIETEKSATSLDPFSTIIPKDTTDPSKLKIFGLSFFENKMAQFESSLNVPTPKNYTLGPGDEIIIDIWGAFEYTYNLLISPEGFIKVEDVGPVQIAGLSIEEATAKINRRLKAIYSSLGENAFSEISLGRLRTINVNVVGEVKVAGTYTTTAFATPFNVLYQAGGPNEIGSLRKIEVFRSGKLKHTLDAYDMLISGKSERFYLQDEDVILVNPYLNRASVDGEVKRPGVYELNGKETLSDLIQYAGGFTGLAYMDRISLRRNINNFRAVKTAGKDEFDMMPIKDGDYVEVKRISNLYKSRVTIEGAVFQPGEYQLDSTLTLSKLIEKAGGLRGDAFGKRVIILRKEEDYSLSSKSINLYNNDAKDVKLNNEDYIKIQSIFDIREEYYIQIEGEVQHPGRYPYVQGQTVEDLILLAGGFKESAAKSNVEVARQNATQEFDKTAEIYGFEINAELQMNALDSKFELKPFDIVAIRKSPYYDKKLLVELSGEVLYPGKYVITRKDERISDIIARAGGLTEYAFSDGARLVRRTEYFEEGSGQGNVSKVRRQELEAILKRDTIELADSRAFPKEETIGIDLVQIMKNPKSEFDLILKEGDLLNVPRELQTVRVRGEVLYPSNVRFSENFGFKDFISQAGGYSSQASKRRAYVLYPNGTAERTKSFLWFKKYPQVTPGTEIILPGKPDRRGLSPQELVGLSTGLASLALILTNIF